MGLLRNAGDLLRYGYDLARLGMTTNRSKCLTPASFAAIASDGAWKMQPFLGRLNKHLTLVAAERAAGRPTNTIVSIPPRHGKSMFVSQYFPAWWLSVFPNDRVILTAYEADFAADWGAKARNAFENHVKPICGLELDPDRTASSHWNIKGYAGGMQTAGAGGALLGKGSNLLIVDDPIKNHEDAESEFQREKLWNWWISTVRSRREPGCAVILIMQRWHEDDLAGKMIANMAQGGDQWTVLEFKALAEEGDILGRPEGEPLWPERFSRQELEQTRTISPYWFAAQYQQDPRPKGGDFFKREWFKDRMVDSAPYVAERCRFWDKAASQGKGDYTVGVLMARDVEGRYYVENVVRDRLGSRPRDEKIRAVCDADRQRYPDVRIRGEQEPGSSGKDAAAAFLRLLDGHDVKAAPVTGNKESRARPFASQCEGGNVSIVKAAWNEAYFDELESFPKGKHDDMVDASSGAYNDLAGQFAAEWGANPFADYRGSIALAG